MSEYLFVKPGLDTGGATTADILTAQALHEVTGLDVRFLTGYISPFASAVAERASIAVEVNPSLDRENNRPSKEVAAAILDNTSDGTRIITSQFFAASEAHLSEAIVEVSERIPTAVRMHNRLAGAAFTAFSQLSSETIGIPIHTFMEQRMRELAPERRTIVIPPIFDTRRFENDPARRHEKGQIVRAQHGIKADDILFVQPTTLTSRKGASSSLHLAAQMKKDTGRDAHLLVAGDTRRAHNRVELMQLLELSSNLGINCLVDGLNIERHRNFSRIGELLCAADIATMPSYEDNVMLSIAEAAYARATIYTRAYTDEDGSPLFDSVYGQLDCIVQRDQNEEPGEGIRQQVYEVLEGTKIIDLEANAAFAVNALTAQGIANKLQNLHTAFDRSN